MKFNINKILSEWAYRVDDGQPDKTNSDHVENLREVLYDFGLPHEFINEYVSNLQELEFRNRKGFDRYVAKHKMRPTTKVTIGGKETTAGELDNTESDSETKKVTKSKLSEKEIAEKLKKDKQSVFDSLAMTVTYSKIQAKQTQKKDVGLGTAASRAGEAMVHTGIQRVQEYMKENDPDTGKPKTFEKVLEEIQDEFTGIVHTDDHILNSKEGRKWVDSTILTLKKINEEVGFENIQNVAWDTDQGREAIGVDPKVNTSSDAFIQLNDGTVLGVSLKKDGNVFIVSGGWDKQSKLVLNGLKKIMGDTEAYRLIEDAMDTKHHATDVDNGLIQATEVAGPAEVQASLKTLKEEIGWDEETQTATGETRFFAGSGLSKYIKRLEDPNLIDRIKKGRKTPDNPDGADGTDRKAYAKLLQTYYEEQAQLVRDADDKLTKRLYERINNSEEAKSGMKQFVMRSLHLSEALGLNETTKAGGIDNFSTFYGEGEGGAILNEKTLITLLGKKFEDTLAKVRSTPPTATKEELFKMVEDQIEFDIEKEVIVFKHENEEEYELFYMGGRAKGMTNAPALEIGQTNLMVYALRNGDFDHNKWSEKERKTFEEKWKRDRE